jgi:hypothetical protein
MQPFSLFYFSFLAGRIIDVLGHLMSIFNISS